MKYTSSVRSTDKKTPAIAKTVTQSEFMELKNKTIEEKRINLALDLRVKGATKIRS